MNFGPNRYEKYLKWYNQPEKKIIKLLESLRPRLRHKRNLTLVRNGSLFIAWRWGVGAEDFRGDHLLFGKKRGGSLKTLEGFRGGGHSNLLGKWRHGVGGGDPGRHQSNIQWWDRLNFTLFSPKSSTLPFPHPPRRQIMDGPLETAAKQRLYPCCGPPTDSTNYRKGLSTWLANGQCLF